MTGLLKYCKYRGLMALRKGFLMCPGRFLFRRTTIVSCENLLDLIIDKQEWHSYRLRTGNRCSSSCVRCLESDFRSFIVIGYQSNGNRYLYTLYIFAATRVICSQELEKCMFLKWLLECRVAKVILLSEFPNIDLRKSVAVEEILQTTQPRVKFIL